MEGFAIPVQNGRGEELHSRLCLRRIDGESGELDEQSIERSLQLPPDARTAIVLVELNCQVWHISQMLASD